ncbi:hypothetical protein H2200_012688 [Cladophialophora chaetospira]|uniref:Uncharacterized protein n=1 Tax=Cladophialophora chaetospira TaxID=386627 RepID=A0AA38WXD3_9EURO|nr:hypothetical protein H2200_012688 [Cladophialophora chaetospira]
MSNDESSSLQPIVISCPTVPKVEPVDAAINSASPCCTITWQQVLKLGEENDLYPAVAGDAHTSEHADKGYKGSIKLAIRPAFTQNAQWMTFCVLETDTAPLVLRERLQNEVDPIPRLFPMASSASVSTKKEKYKKEKGYNAGADEARRQWERDRQELRERERKEREESAAKKPK